MSPDRAEEVFYECYRAGQWGRVDEPLVQRELRLSCWRAVIDAVEREYAAKLAGVYLDGMSDER